MLFGRKFMKKVAASLRRNIHIYRRRVPRFQRQADEYDAAVFSAFMSMPPEDFAFLKSVVYEYRSELQNNLNLIDVEWLCVKRRAVKLSLLAKMKGTRSGLQYLKQDFETEEQNFEYDTEVMVLAEAKLHVMVEIVQKYHQLQDMQTIGYANHMRRLAAGLEEPGCHKGFFGIQGIQRS